MESQVTARPRIRKSSAADDLKREVGGRTKPVGPRIGKESSTTRTALLDAAAYILQHRGYSAVTSGAIAARVGVRQQLVHYYFRKMDDVFIEVFRRHSAQRIKLYAKALGSQTPLKALWELSYNTADSNLAIEFLALSRRQESLRAELLHTTEVLQHLRDQIVSRAYNEYGLGRHFASPEALSLIVDAIGQRIGLEAESDLTRGHARAKDSVDRWIETLEGPARREAKLPSRRHEKDR